MSISTDLTNWWSPVTKPDIESLAGAFNETHPDVKATLVPSNSDGVLRIYITKETPESTTVNKDEMKYSEFLNSKHPLLAIAFRMEEVYREILSDEKESRGPMPTLDDIRDITRTFDMLHPGMSSAIGFDHMKRELIFHLAKGKNVMEDLANAFTRTVPYDEITNNSDPLKAVTGRLEQTYLEFTMENPNNYGPDLTGIVQDFAQSHPDVSVHFGVVNELDAIKLWVEANDGLQVGRMIGRTELRSLNEPVPAITTILEGAYNELLRIRPSTAANIGKHIKQFTAIHPDVMVSMDISKDGLTVTIHMNLETNERVTQLDREFVLSEIDSVSSPNMAISHILEWMYKDLVKIHKEYVLFNATDLCRISNVFNDGHPGTRHQLIIRDELFAVELRIETVDGKAHVQRYICSDDLLTSDTPEDFIFAVMEDAYKELIKQCSNKEEEEMPTKGKSITDAIAVDNDFMINMAKCAVAAWYNMHNGPRKIKPEDVYVVWFCKTLQNWKAMCSTDIPDGMYYEVTYDGDKDVAYVDAYKKWDNESMLGENLRHDVLATSVTLKMTTE